VAAAATWEAERRRHASFAASTFPRRSLGPTAARPLLLLLLRLPERELLHVPQTTRAAVPRTAEEEEEQEASMA
jgi:hypothetical protein